MAYSEDYIRAGAEPSRHHSRDIWNDLIDGIKTLKEHYQEGGHHHMYGADPYYDTAMYRGQPRTRDGRFKARISLSPHEMEMKEELGRRLMEQYGCEWVCEKITGEASELIQAATKHDRYAMMKEFSELCILMAGVEEELSDELIEEACRQASEYYSAKLRHRGHGMSPLHEAYYGGGHRVY